MCIVQAACGASSLSNHVNRKVNSYAQMYKCTFPNIDMARNLGSEYGINLSMCNDSSTLNHKHIGAQIGS